MSLVWGKDKCIKGFGGKNLKERDCWEDLGLEATITLKENINIIVQTGFTREEKCFRQLYYLEQSVDMAFQN